VGQDEVEIVKLADVVVVVLTPGAGDDIQIFKAGLMEIADIFVLNKADSPETARTERQLRAMLELGGPGDKDIPVVKTIATEGVGVNELTRELLKFVQAPRTSIKARKRQQLLEAMVRDIVSQEVFRLIQKKIPAKKLEELMQRLLNRQLDPYSLAEILLQTALEE